MNVKVAGYTFTLDHEGRTEISDGRLISVDTDDGMARLVATWLRRKGGMRMAEHLLTNLVEGGGRHG